MDRRRARFGYGPNVQEMPGVVLSSDKDLLYEHADLFKRYRKFTNTLNETGESRTDLITLWPDDDANDENFTLSWFGMTNRYFALAIHPVFNSDNPADNYHFINQTIETIRFQSSLPDKAQDSDATSYIISPVVSVPAGGRANFDMGLYAGPLDRHVLGEVQPYKSLAMDGLILYQMSSCCSTCTFQWLAKLLLAFLTLLHDYVVFDWGIAIIVLVIVVRSILHPITKKSQVSMQRFGKQMQDLKPELDKLQKKYGNDPKRMQAEQLRMMKERGMNPAQALGCLPMFFQMPIWVALYAMLYFVFDLRQEEAFFGLFQMFGGWSFLGDLSSPDHFISLPFEYKSGRFASTPSTSCPC
jgi:YidC/Oxa1 family membrane protein insertase